MAGTSKLNPPSPTFSKLKLDVIEVSPRKLYRVSRYDSGEPHFGKSGSCRFDDANPDPNLDNRYGTCYLGFNLMVAFAESVLHNAEPSNGRFDVPSSDIDTRFALSFKGSKLKLAKIFGLSLFNMGGNGELSGTPDYALPQAWAAALVAHPANIDGLIYMSRRVNDQQAVVLFHRPGQKAPGLQMDEAIPLADHDDYSAVISALGVKVT